MWLATQRNGAKETEKGSAPRLSVEENRFDMTSPPLFLMEYFPHGLCDESETPLMEISALSHVFEVEILKKCSSLSIADDRWKPSDICVSVHFMVFFFFSLLFFLW